MSFISFHIKQIRSEGMPALLRKMCSVPRWFLRLFCLSKYSSTLAYYGCRAVIAVIPGWLRAHFFFSEILIVLGRYDEAVAVLESAFLLEHGQIDSYRGIYYTLIFHGQIRAARNIIQRYVDTQNNFAREHQLDKLGIRFLRDFTTNIGHIALLDPYIKMDILGQRSLTRPIILATTQANKCYLDYWQRYLPDIISDPLAVDRLLPLTTCLEDYIFAVMDVSGKQIWECYTAERERLIQSRWEAAGRDPLLNLSDSDQERGLDCLKRLGLSTDVWFVGLHARKEHTPIQEARNADINTYRLAMESIIARGGWVIRMGDTTMPPLPPMHHVIDYAHNKVHSDWMDVFLWARCRFFIGTQSGPHMVPPTFGVPCVITNWASLGLRPWFKKDICIFKIFWSKSQARHLNFAEVLASAAASSECAGYRSAQGISLVDNSPEDINDVVVEMLDRLEGRLRYSKEDEELQERFDRLYINSACKANARIGRAFLQKWAHLL